MEEKGNLTKNDEMRKEMNFRDGSNREKKASVFTTYFSILENAADLYAGL